MSVCAFCGHDPAVARLGDGRGICDTCSRNPLVNPGHAFRSWRTRLAWYLDQWWHGIRGR